MLKRNPKDSLAAYPKALETIRRQYQKRESILFVG
jgi:hypothetical protein